MPGETAAMKGVCACVYVCVSVCVSVCMYVCVYGVCVCVWYVSVTRKFSKDDVHRDKH